MVNSTPHKLYTKLHAAEIGRLICILIIKKKNKGIQIYISTDGKIRTALLIYIFTRSVDDTIYGVDGTYLSIFSRWTFVV